MFVAGLYRSAFKLAVAVSSSPATDDEREAAGRGFAGWLGRAAAPGGSGLPGGSAAAVHAARALTAFINRFLVGMTANTAGVDVLNATNSKLKTFNKADWIDWDTPTLGGALTWDPFA